MTAKIHGYASIFNHPYEIGAGKKEVVLPGAFKRTLSEGPDVQLLIGHTGIPLSRTKAGTLSLEEDNRGLKFEATVDETRGDVSDLLKAMSAGALDAASFAFRCTADSWNEDFSLRTVKSVSIHRGDIAICAQGANELAWSAVGPADLASRRAAAEAIGKNMRGSVPFEAFAVEHVPGPERRALGEVGFITVDLEPLFGRASTRARTALTTRAALALPLTKHWQPCKRCGKTGKVDLGGKVRVTCPNCRGTGALRVSVDAPHASTTADGSSRARRVNEHARLMAIGIKVGSLRGTNDGVDVACDLCSGTGRIRAGKVTCPACNGTGKAPPPDDDGTAKNATSALPTASIAAGLESRSTPIKSDGGAGLTVSPCPKCKGKGRLPLPGGGKARCPRCHGSGADVAGKLDPTKTTTPSPVARSTASLLGLDRRSDYSQAELKALWLKGAAYKDPEDGHFCFPTSTTAEFQKACKMVQLTGPEGKARESVRRYLIARAKAMGTANLLPENWNSDGTIASSRAFHY